MTMMTEKGTLLPASYEDYESRIIDKDLKRYNKHLFKFFNEKFPNLTEDEINQLDWYRFSRASNWGIFQPIIEAFNFYIHFYSSRGNSLTTHEENLLKYSTYVLASREFMSNMFLKGSSKRYPRLTFRPSDLTDEQNEKELKRIEKYVDNLISSHGNGSKDTITIYTKESIELLMKGIHHKYMTSDEDFVSVDTEFGNTHPENDLDLEMKLEKSSKDLKVKYIGLDGNEVEDPLVDLYGHLNKTIHELLQSKNSDYALLALIVCNHLDVDYTPVVEGYTSGISKKVAKKLKDALLGKNPYTNKKEASDLIFDSLE